MRFLKYLTLASLMFGATTTFAQENKQPEGVTINEYKLLLTVGLDEDLNSNAVHVGPEGFTTILGWDQAKIDQFRAAAIQWFLERFGIDFTGGTYDPSTGLTFISNAALVPLSFDGTYRVLSSNNEHISDHQHHHPSTVRLAEYTVQFFPGATVTYGGTYANGTPLTGSDTDNLAYGCYRIFNKESPHDYHSFFMRSFYPDTTVPTTASPPPARSFERFQMYSPKWGGGFGILNVAVPGAPNSNGQWPTYTRASWSFPGSFTIGDLNGFTSAPVHVNK